MGITAMTICFIACHGGAANHFAEYANNLQSKGYKVEVYATGPAIDKFKGHEAFQFELNDRSQYKTVADRLATKCNDTASVVITDLGHEFNIDLQKSIAELAPQVKRIAYYDNPEAFVPGGYSDIAAKVMKEAQVVLFANSNLANEPLYSRADSEIHLEKQDKIGLGYYPIEEAVKIENERSSSGVEKRKEFLTLNQIEDSGQQLLVYTGGNNKDYFENAFPAFLDFVTHLMQKEDLSDKIIVLQQHPGAKTENLDGKLLEAWKSTLGRHKHAPELIISKLNTNQALVIADAVIYHQTSMGPQFVLAGIPVIQVAREPYEDILVKNELCFIANSGDDFSFALNTIKSGQFEIPSEKIQIGLGLNEDWSTILEETCITKEEE